MVPLKARQIAQNASLQLKTTESKMNIVVLLFAIICALSNFVFAGRLGGKGNMRGVRTRFSGLTPHEAALLKLFLRKRRYGRFA